MANSLIEFTYTNSGDMIGSFEQIIVKKKDDANAEVTYKSMEHHSAPIVSNSFIVPLSILDEIEHVYKSSLMAYWKNDELHRFFVADGASYSYSFDFVKSHKHFSSQMYPDRHRKKLNKIHAIIAKYSESKKQNSD